MSILKTRGQQPNGKPAELEGSIGELVRRQSNAVQQTNNNYDEAARGLASLVNRVSGDATREVDHLMG
jgi:hypothetical protein